MNNNKILSSVQESEHLLHEDIKVKDYQNLLLDSSLITATIMSNKVLSVYDLKIVDCGEYLQVYTYTSRKTKKEKDNKDEFLLTKNKNFNITNSYIQKKDNKNKLYQIEEKNIIRSKLECQRLAKCNINSWKTFITLTFEEHITDVNIAYQKFRCFIYKIQRIYKDFKYICVPEFTKKGRVHYHLLSNIDINDNRFISLQTDNNYFKHIKYWNEGFTSVEEIKGDVKKIIGYISKYMMKDIDNRLFSHRRYYSSKNLEKPHISYINLDIKKDLVFFNEILKSRKLIYHNNYLDTYDNSLVIFNEYLRD